MLVGLAQPEGLKVSLEEGGGRRVSDSVREPAFRVHGISGEGLLA